MNNNKARFGPKCFQARQNHHDARNTFRSNSNEASKYRSKNASQNYKSTMDYYIKNQRYLNQEQLRKLNENCPKKYWKFLNDLKTKEKNIQSPSLQEFYDHYQVVNENTIDDDRFDNFTPTTDYY